MTRRQAGRPAARHRRHAGAVRRAVGQRPSVGALWCRSAATRRAGGVRGRSRRFNHVPGATHQSGRVHQTPAMDSAAGRRAESEGISSEASLPDDGRSDKRTPSLPLSAASRWLWRVGASAGSSTRQPSLALYVRRPSADRAPPTCRSAELGRAFSVRASWRAGRHGTGLGADASPGRRSAGSWPLSLPTRSKRSRSRTTPTPRPSGEPSGSARERRTPTAAGRRRRFTRCVRRTVRSRQTWRVNALGGARRGPRALRLSTQPSSRRAPS